MFIGVQRRGWVGLGQRRMVRQATSWFCQEAISDHSDWRRWSVGFRRNFLLFQGFVSVFRWGRKQKALWAGMNGLKVAHSWRESPYSLNNFLFLVWSQSFPLLCPCDGFNSLQLSWLVSLIPPQPVCEFGVESFWIHSLPAAVGWMCLLLSVPVVFSLGDWVSLRGREMINKIKTVLLHEIILFFIWILSSFCTLLLLGSFFYFNSCKTIFVAFLMVERHQNTGSYPDLCCFISGWLNPVQTCSVMELDQTAVMQYCKSLYVIICSTGVFPSPVCCWNSSWTRKKKTPEVSVKPSQWYLGSFVLFCRFHPAFQIRSCK